MTSKQQETEEFWIRSLWNGFTCIPIFTENAKLGFFLPSQPQVNLICKQRAIEPIYIVIYNLNIEENIEEKCYIVFFFNVGENTFLASLIPLTQISSRRINKFIRNSTDYMILNTIGGKNRLNPKPNFNYLRPLWRIRKIL